MSFEGVVAIGLAINLVCAIVCSFVASRSGHDPFTWALIGGVIGPIGLIALIASRDRATPRFIGGPPRGASKTLIPTDGSSSSLAAVDQFAARNMPGTVVTLLAVLPVERREAPAADLNTDIENFTGQAKHRLEARGFQCDVAAAFGDPAAEIIRIAREEGFEQIYMGRRGRGGVAKLLLGSVSEKVVKEAPVPVTVTD